MEIVAMALGAYQTNTYLVWGEGSDSCVIIDPGYQPETILDQVEKRGKKVAAILLTHGHFDHVGGVQDIVEKTNCPVYLRPEEHTVPQSMTGGALPHTQDYGLSVELAGLTFRVLHTPGHTPGSVCLLCENVMFSGDTLFAGSCGRTDFSKGDPVAMRKSLNTLANLEGDYHVFPGHGEDTTLSQERRDNPYM